MPPGKYDLIGVMEWRSGWRASQRVRLEGIQTGTSNVRFEFSKPVMTTCTVDVVAAESRAPVDRPRCIVRDAAGRFMHSTWWFGGESKKIEVKDAGTYQLEFMAPGRPAVVRTVQLEAGKADLRDQEDPIPSTMVTADGDVRFCPLGPQRCAVEFYAECLRHLLPNAPNPFRSDAGHGVPVGRRQP